MTRSKWFDPDLATYVLAHGAPPDPLLSQLSAETEEKFPTAASMQICCDVNEEWTSVARRYWKLADVDDHIELHLRPALDTLRGLPADELFDIAFIDANKDGYISYWDEVVPRMRPDGVIPVDNTLYDGLVLDLDSDHPDVPGVRAFDDHAVKDDRVVVVLLSIGDGLTLARKR